MVTVSEGLQYAGLIVTGIVLYGMFAKPASITVSASSGRTGNPGY
jgi:hypothetical protein